MFPANNYFPTINQHLQQAIFLGGNEIPVNAAYARQWANQLDRMIANQFPAVFNINVITQYFRQANLAANRADHLYAHTRFAKMCSFSHFEDLINSTYNSNPNFPLPPAHLGIPNAIGAQFKRRRNGQYAIVLHVVLNYLGMIYYPRKYSIIFLFKILFSIIICFLSFRFYNCLKS